MKSKSEVAKLQDLLQQIQRIDSMIARHKAVNDDFMSSQYEAQKLDFVKKLLSYLINSNLNAVEPQTFFLVQQLMNQYYPAYTRRLSDQPEARLYAEILSANVGEVALSAAQEPGTDYRKK